MNSLDLLNDYEQFTTFFQSLDTGDSSPEPVDIDSILESLADEETSL